MSDLDPCRCCGSVDRPTDLYPSKGDTRLCGDCAFGVCDCDRHPRPGIDCTLGAPTTDNPPTPPTTVDGDHHE